MTIGIASHLLKNTKILGETKNLRVFLKEGVNGKKVIESLDKKTGALVKRVTKGSELDTTIKVTNGDIPCHGTKVECFNPFTGELYKKTSIYHPKSKLEDNAMGQLACHRKSTEYRVTGEDIDAYGRACTPSDFCTDIYTFNPNKNPKGLRAIVDKKVDEFYPFKDSLSLYGKTKAELANCKVEHKGLTNEARRNILNTELYKKFEQDLYPVKGKIYEI